MIYDQTFNVLFQQKMEAIQYNVALTITGTIRSSIIPIHNMSYRTRQCNKIPAINVKHNFFKKTFFPSTIIEWNKLGWEIENSESIVTFRKRILSFIGPSANSTFYFNNP